MRFRVLAAALTLTASPALGQVQQDFLQLPERVHAPDHSRLELTYDLSWDEMQDETESGRWKPILIGAGIGFTVGLALSALWPWVAEETKCIVDDFETGACRPTPFWDKPTPYMIRVSMSGAGIGAALGWLIRRTGDVAADLASSSM